MRDANKSNKSHITTVSFLPPFLPPSPPHKHGKLPPPTPCNPNNKGGKEQKENPTTDALFSEFLPRRRSFSEKTFFFFRKLQYQYHNNFIYSPGSWQKKKSLACRVSFRKRKKNSTSRVVSMKTANTKLGIR